MLRYHDPSKSDPGRRDAALWLVWAVGVFAVVVYVARSVLGG